MTIKAVFAFFLLTGLAAVSFAGTIHLKGSSKMTLTGSTNSKMILRSGTIKVNPVENFWSGLAGQRRFPMIVSGDLIALRLARSGTPKWMQCSRSSYCTTSTCPGGPVIMSSKFSSCPTVIFRIRVLGKYDGEAVESGDYVVLTFPYNSGKTLYCHPATTTPCKANWNLPQTWPKHNWFGWTQGRFQIFSKNTKEGGPIQYQDTVGFRYDYQSNKSWLYSDASKIYARPCSYGHYTKSYCAKINTGFGFQIYKKI